MSTSSDKAADRRVSSVGEGDSSDRTMSEKIERPSAGGILQDALQGTVDHELTYFEQKAALINEYGCPIVDELKVPMLTVLFPLSELDKFGFGKYQKCIWLLCGFGYFLDLAWAQGIILMATAIL